MSPRGRILSIVGALVATGVALLLFDNARPDDRWLVLGAERSLAGEGSGERFAAGLGLFAGPTASNSFVDGEAAGTPVAGRYWSGRTFYDDDGKFAQETVQFPAGEWHEVRTDVLERDVPTLLGGTAVHYRVRVTGAVSADGKHWVFRPELSGQGRGGYSIRTDVQFWEPSGTLEVRVLESFDGGLAERYEFRFALESDGTLRAID